MPRKLSKPFGHIAFSKAGTVQKEMTQLSHVKEVQELEVVNRFAAMLNQTEGGRMLTELRQLSENDQDFSALVSGAPLQIQLTELVDRSYTFDMTTEEYNSGAWREAIQDQYGAQPRRVQIELRDRALTDLIDRKIAKFYAKPASSELWLVVFSTTNYLTEYVKGGVPRVSEALRLARLRLRDASSAPFDEIWFTNLQTRPVRIWPAST